MRNIYDSPLPLKREISPISQYIITASHFSRGFISDLEFGRTQNKEITLNIRSIPSEDMPFGLPHIELIPSVMRKFFSPYIIRVINHGEFDDQYMLHGS